MLLPTMLVSYFPFELAFFCVARLARICGWLVALGTVAMGSDYLTLYKPRRLVEFELGQTGVFVERCCFLAG